MILIGIIKYFIGDLCNYLRKAVGYARLKSKNPTCRFDKTASISQSEFERYVVIFNNTQLYRAKVNAYSYIQMNGRIFNCNIGRFCSIAASVTIAPGMHDMTKVATNPIFVQKSTPLPKVFAKNDNINDSAPVNIGHDVWIGEKVVILDGVTIGNGAVIAAGAVVNRDVDPYSVVGGVPAKHIKYRFDRSTIDLLQESRWWDFSDEWFERNAELMIDTERFIEKLKCS